jgi:hypothetical protein
MSEIKYINYGTFWCHEKTSEKIAQILSDLYYKDTRIRLHYGNTETGKDWEEEYDTTGRIGRSTGHKKIPLLAYNRRSLGGGEVISHCIVRIQHANKKDGGDIYRHPNYYI